MPTFAERLRKINPLETGAFFLSALTPALGHAFTLGAFDASIIWPTIGVALAFYTFRRRRGMAIALFLGVFTGYLFSYSILQDVEPALILPRSLFSTAGTIISVLAGVWTLGKLRFFPLLKKRKLPCLIPVFILISLINALIGNISLALLEGMRGSQLLESFIIWAAGDLSGLLIIGVPLLLALVYDKKPTALTLRHEILFLLVLTLFSILFFSDNIPYINYGIHNFAYIPFTVVAAVFLSYRMLFIGFLIFLTLMAIYPPFLFEVGYRTYMLEINMFLTFNVLAFIAIRFIRDDIRNKERNLQHRKRRLEQLFESAEYFFSLSSTPGSEDIEGRKAYAKKMFRMVFSLFDTIDYGACLVQKDGQVQYIDTVGHDIDYLNSISDNIEHWLFDLKKPLHHTHMETRLKESMDEETYAAYSQRNPALKESILMSFNLSENTTCEMSFDIGEGSSRTFDSNMYEYFVSLHALLNSFFEIEDTLQEHDVLKQQMISALLKTLALYESYTKAHSEDVAHLAYQIGERLRLHPETLDQLFWSGIVHDLGKLGLPPEITKKKGVFSVEEYEQMQSHPKLGADVIRMTNTLEDVADYVAHHHERYDGKGYPERLKGGEMSVESGVLAISEAIGAMMHERPWAKKKSRKEIIKTLKQERGAQFMPECVDAAVELIEEGLIDHQYNR